MEKEMRREGKGRGNEVEDIRWQVGCHDALNELTSTLKAKGPINQARCETGKRMHKKGGITTNLRNDVVGVMSGGGEVSNWEVEG